MPTKKLIAVIILTVALIAEVVALFAYGMNTVILALVVFTLVFFVFFLGKKQPPAE